MALVLSLVVLCATALAGGAVVLWRRGGSKLQIALMLVLAAVMAVNIAIWTLPVGGSAPLTGTIK